MLRFFGQPKFDPNAPELPPVGYELFIRQWRNNQWSLVENFSAISADSIEQMLKAVIAVMPARVRLLSFNLEQDQFINPEYIDMVARVQSTTSIQLFTELTERLSPNITAQQLVRASREFHQRHLLVCIDDVGTGQNTPELVLQMDPYIDEYKFAFQNFRPFKNIREISVQLNFWYNLAHKQHKMLALEGLETQEELEVVQAHYPCDVIQGFLMGKPAPIAMAS